ncbi:MAG: FtsQ-type POTRA domain-containing protein [Sandarakinorhabdus sp.]|nr:FtsQ-type POTRA domain-containing protein [Sandarakinorhabdus sp.]
MTATTLKRGATPPRQKPVAKLPHRPATVALPISQHTLRRNLAIAIGGLAVIAAVIIAGLMGVWRRAGDEIVRQTAVAGFEVRHVEVTGTRELALLPVYQAALPGRDNAMLTSDLAAIRDRLRALPWVADASVSRRLPDTLAIAITERRPVALWQHHQRLQAIDIAGVALTHDRLERFANLPLVVGPGANTRVREFLILAATAPTLAPKVDAAVLVGGRRWDLKFKTGEILSLPDTPVAANAALKQFARLDDGQSGRSGGLLGGRFERFDMRLPGKMIVGGAAVKQALDANAKLAKAAAAAKAKPLTI